MRIVDRKEFLELPSGTLYAKYTSLGCFGDLAIKQDSAGTTDWWYLNLINGWAGCDSSEQFFEVVQQAEQGIKELRNDLECISRDGLYEDEQKFAVYDEKDVLELIDKLASTCLKMNQ